LKTGELHWHSQTELHRRSVAQHQQPFNTDAKPVHLSFLISEQYQMREMMATSSVILSHPIIKCMCMIAGRTASTLAFIPNKTRLLFKGYTADFFHIKRRLQNATNLKYR